MSYPDQLINYLECLQNLRAESIEPVLELITDDFKFTDPFNAIDGKLGYQAVLRAALEDSREMQFKITKIIREDSTAFLTWDYSFLAANKTLGAKRILIQGMSEIRIAESGLISYHKDYWDVASTVYERIPVLGYVLKFLRKRIAVIPSPPHTASPLH